MTGLWLWLAIAYGLFNAATLPFFYGRRLNACFHLEVIQFLTCWFWPLAAPMTTRIIDGDIKINRNTATFGTLRISMGRFWQWKYVKPIGKTGYCWMLNFGWLLDDSGQDKALFLFSPRIAKFHPASK